LADTVFNILSKILAKWNIRCYIRQLPQAVKCALCVSIGYPKNFTFHGFAGRVVHHYSFLRSTRQSSRSQFRPIVELKRTICFGIVSAPSLVLPTVGPRHNVRHCGPATNINSTECPGSTISCAPALPVRPWRPEGLPYPKPPHRLGPVGIWWPP
jgi:hypothetical protein